MSITVAVKYSLIFRCSCYIVTKCHLNLTKHYLGPVWLLIHEVKSYDVSNKSLQLPYHPVSPYNKLITTTHHHDVYNINIVMTTILTFEELYIYKIIRNNKL